MSSTNICILEWTISGVSFMKQMKTKSPNTLPWCIPLRTSAASDFTLLTTTWRFLYNRNSSIHVHILPDMPHPSIFIRSQWDVMESNAFAKSKYTTSISFLLSKSSVHSSTTVSSWATQNPPLMKSCWHFMRRWLSTIWCIWFPI